MVEKGVIHITPKGNKVFNYIITYKCNNNCIMCINNQPDNRIDPKIDDIKNIISKLDKNVNYLFITGGEPTLRKEFFEIMDFINTNFKGEIHLLTNARMFSYDKFMYKFNSLKINKIILGVPLYAHEKNVFEAVSRAKQSYSQTILGIKNLLSYNYEVELRIIIHKLNYKILPDIAHYILKELPSIKNVFFANMEYVGNGLKNKKALYVRLEDVKPYLQNAVDILESKTNISINQMPLCKLDKKYHKHADNCTVVPNEHMFLKECYNCRLKMKCSGYWRSYIGL
ncbi:MAG: radical SAM protein [archaeon]